MSVKQPSAPHDPWKDARQWAEQGLWNARVIASTKTGQERMGWLEDVQYWQSLVDALVSQAETICQQAAEIATLRATVDQQERDIQSERERRVAAQEAITGHWQPLVDQQQARIMALRGALKQLIVEAEDEFCRNPTCGCSNQLALQAARQALETP